MAQYDIKTCSIDSNGWVASITLDTMSGGGSYDFGYATNNDPTSAKIVFSLTSEGYTGDTLGTKARTIYGTYDFGNSTNTGALRKVYPNQTDPDEAASGADLIIRVPLSKPIFDDDTAITVSIGADWYTQVSGNNVVSGLSVTNNSTLDYPKIIGNWGNVQREIVKGNFDLEFLAFHGFAEAGKQIAAIKFTVTDESANSVSYTVTEMTKSSKADLHAVIAYIQNINVSTLDTNEFLTCNAKIYPWIGDADSIMDTGDAVNSFPTPLYTDLTVKLYKNDELSYCVVDPTNGNDGSGTVYVTQSAAESAYAGDNTTAYATLPTALTGAQAYNNSNYSRNNAGGSFLLCVEDTHLLDTTNGGTLTEWVEITKLSTATRANVTITTDGSNSNFPNFCKLNNVYLSSNTYFVGSGSQNFWANLVDLNMTSGTTNIYDCPYICYTFCEGAMADGFDSFGSSDHGLHILRSNNMDDSSICKGFVVIGNTNILLGVRGNDSIPFNDNLVFAYNVHTGTAITNQFRHASGAVVGDNIVHGIAIVQNIFQRITSQIEPIMSISADGTVTTTNNVLLFYNTFAGGRCNLAYNDNGSGPESQTNWYAKGNIFADYNNKDDVFSTNANDTGSWPVGYCVGWNSNHVRTSADDEWFGEFPCGLWSIKGTSATPLEPGYVDDESADGGDSGNGDYHLTGGNALLTFSKVLLLPYDLEGTARKDNGAIGVYTSGTTIIPIIINHLKQQGML